MWRWFVAWWRWKVITARGDYNVMHEIEVAEWREKLKDASVTDFE